MTQDELRRQYKKAQKFYDKANWKTKLFILIRQELCNGTTDCENYPECPKHMDGCGANTICEAIIPMLEKEIRLARGYCEKEEHLKVISQLMTSNSILEDNEKINNQVLDMAIEKDAEQERKIDELQKEIFNLKHGGKPE